MVFPIEHYMWKLFSEYKNIYTNEIVVFGSAALTKFGIIEKSEAHDIDITINNRLWNILLEKYKSQRSRLGDQVVQIGEIELFNSFGFDLKFSDVFSKSVKFGGWHYMHPEDLREWYKSSGREKDLEKIKRIDLYLKKLSDVKS